MKILEVLLDEISIDFMEFLVAAGQEGGLYLGGGSHLRGALYTCS